MSDRLGRWSKLHGAPLRLGSAIWACRDGSGGFFGLAVTGFSLGVDASLASRGPALLQLHLRRSGWPHWDRRQQPRIAPGRCREWTGRGLQPAPRARRPKASRSLLWESRSRLLPPLAPKGRTAWVGFQEAVARSVWQRGSHSWCRRSAAAWQAAALFAFGIRARGNRRLNGSRERRRRLDGGRLRVKISGRHEDQTSEAKARRAAAE